VQLVNQSTWAKKNLCSEQKEAGVPEEVVLEVQTCSKTMWNGRFYQMRKNHVLKPFIDTTVHKFKALRRSNTQSLPDVCKWVRMGANSDMFSRLRSWS